MRTKYNISILLVEDEVSISTPLEKLISQMVREVHLAANGEDGLSLFKKNNIDIVITDLNMPVMDGLTLAREIKRIKADTVVVIISGSDETDVLNDEDRRYIDEYLFKPIKLDLLKKLIAENSPAP